MRCSVFGCSSRKRCEIISTTLLRGNTHFTLQRAVCRHRQLMHSFSEEQCVALRVTRAASRVRPGSPLLSSLRFVAESLLNLLAPRQGVAISSGLGRIRAFALCRCTRRCARSICDPEGAPTSSTYSMCSLTAPRGTWTHGPQLLKLCSPTVSHYYRPHGPPITPVCVFCRRATIGASMKVSESPWFCIWLPHQN